MTSRSGNQRSGFFKEYALHDVPDFWFITYKKHIVVVSGLQCCDWKCASMKCNLAFHFTVDILFVSVVDWALNWWTFFSQEDFGRGEQPEGELARTNQIENDTFHQFKT